MANSYIKHISDGVTTRFFIPFKYFDASHVNVFTETSDVFFNIDETTNEVVLAKPIPATKAFWIRRQTPITRNYSDFRRGNRFGEQSVNNSFLWQLYIAQELAENSRIEEPMQPSSDMDMNGYKIRNLGAPVENTDAVRLMDLYGGTNNSVGVLFFKGDTFVSLPKSITTPERASIPHYFEFSVKFFPTLFDRVILSNNSSALIAISASLKSLIVSDGVSKLTLDISDLEFKEGTQSAFTIESAQVGGFCELRVRYGEKTSKWLKTPHAQLSYSKLFGGLAEDNSAQCTVYSNQFRTPDRVVTWSYDKLTSRTIPSTEAVYTGTIIGESYSLEDPDDETAPPQVQVSSSIVSFNPQGTSFSSSSRNVDKVLKEIDLEFYRRKQGNLDPDPSDPQTPMVPNSHWVADTLTKPRERVLPKNSPIGATYLIRDGSGRSSINPIKILRNGHTIMGRDSDLIVNTNWGW